MGLYFLCTVARLGKCVNIYAIYMSTYLPFETYLSLSLCGVARLGGIPHLYATHSINYYCWYFCESGKTNHLNTVF